MLNLETQVVTALDFLDEVDKISSKEQVDAINLTARETELRTINRAASELTVPSTYIRQHIRIRSVATESRMEASVQAREKQTNLTRFKHTDTENGVIVERRKGKVDNIEGAFLFVSRTGSVLIGLNKTRLKTKYPRVKINSGTSKIQALYGPTPNQIFFSKGAPIALEIMDEQAIKFLEGVLR